MKMSRLVWADTKPRETQLKTLYIWLAEKYLKTYTALNIVVDSLQQQNISLAFSYVSQLQESKAIVGIDTMKLDSLRLEKKMRKGDLKKKDS